MLKKQKIFLLKVCIVLMLFTVSFLTFFNHFSTDKNKESLIANASNNSVIEDNISINPVRFEDSDIFIEANTDLIYKYINESFDFKQLLNNDINAFDLDILNISSGENIDGRYLKPNKDFVGDVFVDYIAINHSGNSNLLTSVIRYTDKQVELVDDSIEIDGTTNIDLLENDIITGDFNIDKINGANLGSVVYLNYGRLNYIDGDLIYSPYEGVFGRDFFKYSINDEIASVEILSKPNVSIHDDFYEINSNTSIKLDLLTNDEGNLHIEKIYSQFVDDFAVFTPAVDFKGVVKFDYVAVDQIGIKHVGSVEVLINNKPPVAVPDLIGEDYISYDQILSNDFDLDGQGIKILKIGGYDLSNKDKKVEFHDGYLYFSKSGVESHGISNVDYELIDLNGATSNSYIVFEK